MILAQLLSQGFRNGAHGVLHMKEHAYHALVQHGYSQSNALHDRHSHHATLAKKYK